MKKYLSAAFVLVMTLLLASCARVKTHVTVYNPTEENLQGGTYSYMLLDNQAMDPYYSHVSSLLDTQLQAKGMQKVNSNPKYVVVLVYHIMPPLSPSGTPPNDETNLLEVGFFNSLVMYDLRSKPVYLVDVVSEGRPKDPHPNDALQHMVTDGFKVFPAHDGQVFEYPENY